MNYEALFASARDKVVRVGLVGVGDFGATLLARSKSIPNLEVTIICDTDSARMQSAVTACGLTATPPIMTDNIMASDMPDFDVLVEATGHPGAAAEVAEWAILQKRHVVLASKEAAVIVGPILHELATRNGVVYTEVEGDQPSLLIGLVSWARMLGLDIIGIGKSSEYDYVLDQKDTLNWLGNTIEQSGMRDLWREDGHGWQALSEQRHAVLSRAGFPFRSVADFCEMGVVANATGFMPDRPDLHAPVLRHTELADAFQLTTDGGLFEATGRIDVFNCLRRPDEASFAGGVFIVVRCDDETTWNLLREKGHVVAKNGKTAMLYNGQHLLGVEAPISILCAGLLGLPTGASAPRQHVDLVARTTRAFEKGDILKITDPHHHAVEGLAPELVPASPLGNDNPLPYYLATGGILLYDVPAGACITGRMIGLDENARLVRLRRQQDTMSPSS